MTIMTIMTIKEFVYSVRNWTCIEFYCNEIGLQSQTYRMMHEPFGKPIGLDKFLERYSECEVLDVHVVSSDKMYVHFFSDLQSDEDLDIIYQEMKDRYNRI